MSIHSFIMARVIDQNKLVRVKEAAMQLVVENGYGGASISKIAKKAGVAEGYLYRFYGGKLELVNDLLNERGKDVTDTIRHLLEEEMGFAEVFASVVNYFFELGKKQPIRIKFFYVLMNDYSFQIEEHHRVIIRELCDRLIVLGRESEDIDKSVSREELYMMMIDYPVQFMNNRFKSMFGKTEWSEAEQSRVISFGLNALKKLNAIESAT